MKNPKATVQNRRSYSEYVAFSIKAGKEPMQSFTCQEKRAHARFNIEIPLTSALSPSCAAMAHARTHDISSRGLGVILHYALPLGQPAELCMVLPENGQRLSVRGTPVWCQPIGDDCYRLGISLDAQYFNPITTALKVIDARLHLKRKLSSWMRSRK